MQFLSYNIVIILWSSVVWLHYSDVIMGAMASQITNFTIVYSSVYSEPDQWINENTNAPCHWPLWEFTGDRRFPTQRTSKAENVSIWWRHHEFVSFRYTAKNHFVEKWNMFCRSSCIKKRCLWNINQHFSSWCIPTFNTLRPRQNGSHFPDDIFKWIFLNENVSISIDMSLMFVPNGPINNIPALV